MKLPPHYEKIISVAEELLLNGRTEAPTREWIAAAFVLNRQYFLPKYYRDMVSAWDELGPVWQNHVRDIKQSYMHLIHYPEDGRVFLR